MKKIAKNLLAPERRNKLIEMINSSGSVRIGELAAFFGVTTETIRKDLILLDKDGKIRKSFGGAVAVSEFHERNVGLRIKENARQKADIAQRALGYITENRVIFLDSGSSVLALARLLPEEMDITVITNSLPVMNVLARSKLNTLYVGGEFSGVTLSTYGFWATSAISTIKFDIAVLGTSGFQSHDGPCVKSFADAQLKKEVLRNSTKRIVLADSTKFSANAVVQYAKWSEIDTLVTDKGAPAEYIEAYLYDVETIIV